MSKSKYNPGRDGKKKKYKFSANREMTTGEREMFDLAEDMAEKIHYAGLMASIGYFEKLDFEGFKKACDPFGEEIKPEPYNFFMPLFYDAYCNGFKEGQLCGD